MRNPVFCDGPDCPVKESLTYDPQRVAMEVAPPGWYQVHYNEGVGREARQRVKEFHDTSCLSQWAAAEPFNHYEDA